MSMNLPKLRFKDDDGREFPDWEQKIISDIVKSLDAGVSVNSEDRKPLKDEYSVLKTSCVTLGTFDVNERKVVAELNEIKRLKEPLLDNSIVISRMNTPLLVGANSYIKHAPKKTFLPDRLWQIKIFPDFVNMRWLSFWFNNGRNLENVRNLATGTSNSMKNITKPDLMALDILVASIQEQTKIANFLTAIDEKITQLTQKHDCLKQYKKGVMQQIFTQKLRFKDDDGQEFPEWEEKKLKDVCTVKYGKDHKHLEEGNIPLLGTGGIMKYVNQHIYDKPSVLIGRKGTIDKPQFIETPFWTVDTLFYTEINENYVPYFVYLLVSQVDWYKYNEATGVPSLNTTAINNVGVRIPPDIKEQTKIANFLTAIDEKITKTQTQLEAVKQYKKGLLQQMFV